MPVPESSTAFCLERVGRTRPGWDTLVVSGAADTTLPAGDLWAVWADLEHWPLWSPLHRSVTRTAPGGLAAGMTFDQQIGLGFRSAPPGGPRRAVPAAAENGLTAPPRRSKLPP